MSTGRAGADPIAGRRIGRIVTNALKNHQLKNHQQCSFCARIRLRGLVTQIDGPQPVNHPVMSAMMSPPDCVNTSNLPF